MEQIHFGIIGGGWRAAFFVRIAQALPERFQVRGIVVRDAEKGEKIEREWGVKTYRTLEAMLHEVQVTFVIVSVPRSVSLDLLRTLAERRIPALAETPPAGTLEELNAVHVLTQRGAKIQVAEQYHFQPLHMARWKLVESGRLGTVTQAQVSVAHDYHGVSLMRKFLGISFENVTITARRFTSPLVNGPSRLGPPEEDKIVASAQVIAHLDFGEKLGIYDFCGDQYRSWIRSARFLVRGERGEIHDGQVRYLQDAFTPISLNLQRLDAGQEGNLDGYYHRGIMAGSEWVYQNPFAPARLNDDEIAIATCMEKMVHYIEGGPDFYSVAEAAQDTYLGLMIKQALDTGQVVKTSTQAWAKE